MSSLLNFTGLASGLDTASIVSALVDLESAPIKRLESSQAQLRTKSDKLEAINGLLKTLQDSADALKDPSSINLSEATSSLESAVTVETTGTALPGSFALRVNALASNQRSYSGTVDDPNAALGTAGDLTITLGTTDQSSYTVTLDANTTLNGLADMINESGADVRAGVIYDGSQYRMVVSGNRMGADAGAIGFSGQTQGLTTMVAAADADFELDGLDFSSDSNTVSEVIPGVTFNLLSVTEDPLAATPGPPVNISIKGNNDLLAEQVENFVSAYNAAVSRIDRDTSDRDLDNLQESLFGDSTLRMVRSRLSSDLSSAVAGLGAFNSAASIGLSVDRYGTLSLDRTKLDAALASDSDAVTTLFQETTTGGVAGIMGRLATTLESITDPTDGLIPSRIDGIDGRVRDMDDQIARTQVRIDAFEARLKQQFATMEQLVGGLNSQREQLTAMLSGLSS